MIKGNVTTKITGDKEYKAFFDKLKKVKNAFVTIGVHENAGQYSDGTSVFKVALWNEFGTETSPSRPFMRNVVYGKEDLINQWRLEVVKQILDGKMTVEKALETLGFRVKELVKNQINSNIPPPNAPSTVAHKRREGVAPRTLVESTLLLRSIEYRVVVQ
jgi:hypothetical protein